MNSINSTCHQNFLVRKNEITYTGWLHAKKPKWTLMDKYQCYADILMTDKVTTCIDKTSWLGVRRLELTSWLNWLYNHSSQTHKNKTRLKWERSNHMSIHLFTDDKKLSEWCWTFFLIFVTILSNPVIKGAQAKVLGVWSWWY